MFVFKWKAGRVKTRNYIARHTPHLLPTLQFKNLSRYMTYTVGLIHSKRGFSWGCLANCTYWLDNMPAPHIVCSNFMVTYVRFDNSFARLEVLTSLRSRPPQFAIYTQQGTRLNSWCLRLVVICVFWTKTLLVLTGSTREPVLFSWVVVLSVKL